MVSGPLGQDLDRLGLREEGGGGPPESRLFSWETRSAVGSSVSGVETVIRLREIQLSRGYLALIIGHRGLYLKVSY